MSPVVRPVTAHGPLTNTLNRNFSQIMVSISACAWAGNPASRQTAQTRSRRFRQTAAQFTETDQLPAVVMGMAGPAQRRPEAADDTDQHIVGADRAGDPFRCAEAILDRQDQRVVAQQRAGGPRRGRNVAGLGRNHHEIADAGFGGIGGRGEPHGTVRRSRLRRAARHARSRRCGWRGCRRPTLRCRRPPAAPHRPSPSRRCRRWRFSWRGSG